MHDPLTCCEGASHFMSGVLGKQCTSENALVVPKALASSVTTGHGMARNLQVAIEAVRLFNLDCGPKREVAPGPGSILDFKQFATNTIANIFQFGVQPAHRLLDQDELMKEKWVQGSLIIQEFVGSIRQEAIGFVDRYRADHKKKLQKLDLDDSLRYLETIESKTPKMRVVARSIHDQMQGFAKTAFDALTKLHLEIEELLKERRRVLFAAEEVCSHPGNLASAEVIVEFRKLEIR